MRVPLPESELNLWLSKRHTLLFYSKNVTQKDKGQNKIKDRHNSTPLTTKRFVPNLMCGLKSGLEEYEMYDWFPGLERKSNKLFQIWIEYVLTKKNTSPAS